MSLMRSSGIIVVIMLLYIMKLYKLHGKIQTAVRYYMVGKKTKKN